MGKKLIINTKNISLMHIKKNIVLYISYLLITQTHEETTSKYGCENITSKLVF